jgi:hypothetical protein
MMPNRTYELRKLYFQQSRYAAAEDIKKDDSPPLLQWPSNGYFEKLKPDADLLQQALSPRAENQYDDLSAQVFGQELRTHHISLQHQAHLFYERCRLHQRHIRDIDERHLEIQGNRFGVEINNFPDRSRRLGTLEGQLLQLEQQRRDEELAFWKDTVELREKLFEGAAVYSDTRHRYAIVSDAEEAHG